MKSRLAAALDYLDNLYVGWIKNPLVDVWNDFADFHNARVERRQARTIHLADDDDSMTATVDGKTYRIRELWFDEDFGKVIDAVTGKKRKRRKTRPKART